MALHFSVEDAFSRQELHEFVAFVSEPGITIDKAHEWVKSRGKIIGRTAVGNWIRHIKQDAKSKIRGDVDASLIFKIALVFLRQQQQILICLRKESNTNHAIEAEYAQLNSMLQNLMESSNERIGKKKRKQQD